MDLNMASSVDEPSLVCVGGMLRVANVTRRSSPPPSLVTPFKQLASPFTATAPFTAPTTPCSTITPYSTASLHTPRTYNNTPLYTPVPTSTPTHTQDLQPQPQPHLLSQKQVRELRRLCRKTANRAHFEGRLTQIRQVASIAAMATSTLHLFDPRNPHSGHALRVWVAHHRADGADWRDERPLSHDAVAELRRWDLLLKSWARLHFESANGEIREQRNDLPYHSDALKPVRLEFEKVSLAASPTPATPANLHKPRNVYSTDFLRLASPVTPADAGLHHLATPSPAAAVRRVDEYSIVNATGGMPMLNPMVAQGNNNNNNNGGATEDHHIGSAWGKTPLTGLTTRRVDSRKPLTEVCINREGDHIRVTVPPSAKSCMDTRFAGMNDQENMIPTELRRAPMTHASTTAKSWRNALMSTEAPRDTGTQGMRTAAKTLFQGHDLLGEEDVGLRSPLDWGKLRRGEHGLGETWQGRLDNSNNSNNNNNNNS